MLFRSLISAISLIAFAVNGHQNSYSQGEHRQLPNRVPHVKDVTSGFQSCQSKVLSHRSSFETACQQKRPKALVQGIVDIRTSIVSLSAQVHAGVGVWVSADLDAFANLYVGLLAKVQILLEIVHSHGLTDSCKDSILALNVPLNALLLVFLNAQIDVGALLDVHVDLKLLVSIGISLNLNVHIGATVGVGV